MFIPIEIISHENIFKPLGMTSPSFYLTPELKVKPSIWLSPLLGNYNFSQTKLRSSNRMPVEVGTYFITPHDIIHHITPPPFCKVKLELHFGGVGSSPAGVWAVLGIKDINDIRYVRLSLFSFSTASHLCSSHSDQIRSIAPIKSPCLQNLKQ